MSDATFACPDLTTFCRLNELGFEVTGQLAAGRSRGARLSGSGSGIGSLVPLTLS